ncbi:MAG: prepilin peptidase [Acidobacteriota bacterium]
MYLIIDNIIIFVLGTVIGSFLNVCICRLPEEQSVVTPPSRCMACGHRLGFLDLFPVLSFLFLRGKCRYCGTKVSWQYPLVELVTGLLYLLVWYKFGLTWMTLAGLVFVSVLITISVIDIYHQIIPDAALAVGAVAGIPLMYLQGWDVLKDGLIAGGGGLLFMLAVAIIGGLIAGQEAMGMGDVKLTAFMGLYLGVKGLVIGMFTGFMAGGVIGVILMVTGLKGRKDAIPFGPYLALGGLIAFFWGADIWNWYTSYWKTGM